MADYANLLFKNYIPDKDIKEKIMIENPVPSNLQEVPILDNFVEIQLVSQTVITNDHRMEKFQEMVHYHDSGKHWKIFERICWAK